LPNLQKLWLWGNQIGEGDKYVHALRDRGVTVYL